MKTFTIRRTHYRNDGVFGVIDFEGVPFALTVELPWSNNLAEKSCIPTGTYTCKRIVSPRFGDTFEVCNVKDRSHILIHRANTVKDILGCIGIGEQFGSLDGLTAVLDSAKGFSEFLFLANGEKEFQLIISN